MYNWISVLFPKNINFCPTPAESGATPAEFSDSVRNQWGTEKYCQLSCRYLPSNPSHPFVYMLAWALAAAGVQLPCSALRWLVGHVTISASSHRQHVRSNRDPYT